MRVTERPFSDLLRHPNDVTRDLDDGDIVLRRRDEPDLRLSLAGRDADRAEAIAAVSRALRNLAVHHPDALGGALTDAFPWVEFLPRADRRLFIDEFTRVVVASTAIDNFSPLAQVIREWQATAEVHADAKLARRLRRPIDGTGDPVTAPGR